jgi:signal transduction histidine kinase
MRHFYKLSLKNKLTFMAMLTCGAVLILSSAIFVGTEIVVQRRAVVEELETLGEIISNNSTAAIIFQDRQSLDEILGALEAKPNITSASIFGRDGKVLVDYPFDRPAGERSAAIAAFQRDPTSLAVTTREFAVEFRDGFAELTAPIVFDSEFIGLLTIRYGLARMYAVIKIYLFVSVAVVALSFILAFLLFAKMQEFISRPIRALLRTMREVSEDQDYSLRVQPNGDDEIGKLMNGFNQMLEQIEAHEMYLSEARRQAETANRAKTEFLANMSHELRTPLNAVLGFSEILMREFFGPLGSKKYQGYAGDIHDSGHLLLDVINDVLDISKVEAGKIELTEEELDLDDLVRKSAHLVKQRALDAGVSLTISVEDSVPKVFADERLVKQTLLNLLSNAVMSTCGSKAIRTGPSP